MAALRLLALATATGRVGAVCLSGGQLKDWQVSNKAARSPELAAEQLEIWIDRLTPDVVVTEAPEGAARKGDKTKALTAAMAQVAAARDLLDVAVARPRDYPNKYDEAEALALRHPEIRAWLPPKRRFFDNEPRNTVLFEALALAEEVMRGGPEALARAMG